MLRGEEWKKQEKGKELRVGKRNPFLALGSMSQLVTQGMYVYLRAQGLQKRQGLLSGEHQQHNRRQKEQRCWRPVDAPRTIAGEGVGAGGGKGCLARADLDPTTLLVLRLAATRHSGTTVLGHFGAQIGHVFNWKS